MENFLKCVVVMTMCITGSLSMPLGRNDDMRIRRQVTRFNIVAALRPAIASGDREICGGVCLEYSLNERQRAMDDPFRGPDAQSQFLPSGGTTYARRYFQQFFFLYLACVSAFCQFPSPTTEPPTTAEPTTTAEMTTLPATTEAATTTAATASTAAPQTTGAATTTAAPMTTQAATTAEATTTVDTTTMPPATTTMDSTTPPDTTTMSATTTMMMMMSGTTPEPTK